MTFRERFLAALHAQPVDVLPWFADFTYWRHARELAGDLPPEYAGEAGLVRLHRDYHVGYYLGYATVCSEDHENVQVLTETEGDLTRTLWRTPIGEIWGETRFLPATASSAPTRWAVQTPDELRVLRYVADSTRVMPHYDSLERLKELAGDQGHPTIFPPRSPVSQLLVQWTGATHLSFLLADARPEVELTLEALGRAADGHFAALAAADVPWVEFADNLSGEVIGGLFRRYQFDYYLRRTGELHAAGKLVGVHLDGTMRQLLPLLSAAGMDFVEGFAPYPCGDVPVEELRELAGPDLVLVGGVPGAMFTPPFTPERVRRHVERIFEHHWGSHRFVLAVGDQVPPNADMELLRLLSAWCEELSR